MPIFAEGLIRGMNVYRTTALGGKRPFDVSQVPILFSNSGSGVSSLPTIVLAGPTVLSAVGVDPPHDGVNSAPKTIASKPS
jgi:hypothetical protein